MTETAIAPPAAATIPVKPPTLRQTHAGRFKLGGHYTQDWEVVVETGTTVDDMLKPEFWAHVAKQLRQYSKIKVLPDDGSYYAELLVQSAGNVWAKCVVLHHVEFTARQPSAAEAPSHTIEYAGPHHKWRVVSNAGDRPVVSKEHASREDAALWLNDHLKAIGR